jgi:hypothetical protein
MVTHDRLRLPIKHDHDIDPAHTLHQHLGHIDAPPLVWLGGFGLTTRWGPLGFQLQVGRDQEAMRSHQAPHPLFVHRELLHKPQVGPDAAVTPEGMLSLQRLEAWEKALISLYDSQRPLPHHASHSSLFLTSG